MDVNLENVLDTAVEAISTFGLKLIGVLVVLVIAWIVARWARRAVERSLTRTRLDVTLTKFFANATGWLILLLAVLAVLGIFGIQTTSFAAVLGAAGLAIGLAFQGTLSNLAAGVMLLTFRPFKVGDAVKVAGETGIIDEIDLFVTKLDTFDNRRIVIPNSKIFGDKIETITYHPIRRADVAVGTDYDADLDEVRTVLEQAAAGVEGGLPDPAPQVVLDGLGDSSINWTVRLWCNTIDYLATKQALTRAIKHALDEAGIGIPYPQMDVHLDQSSDDGAPKVSY
jgi:small conductance mechanosensitive channel